MPIKEAELLEAGAAVEAARAAANPNPALADLLAALEPFAAWGRAFGPDWARHTIVATGSLHLDVSDFRRAEQALANYHKAGQS